MGGGQPALHLLGPDVAVRRRAPAAALVAAVLALTACSGDDEPAAEPTGAAPSATDAPVVLPEAPPVDACYRLSYDEALAPTSRDEPVPCGSRHTARTVAVGDLPLAVDGHLLAVDSRAATEHAATTCPRRVDAVLGGTPEQRRLSLLRAVWFTPTLAESDAGAAWFRCDVVAVTGEDDLAPLGAAGERLRGLLDRPAGDAFATCGTAEPGTDGFARVPCAEPHAWRAVEVVPLDGERYPGTDAARSAGEVPCEDAGRARAADPLDFEWGYEWPTQAQWEAGRTWGLCWVPD